MILAPSRAPLFAFKLKVGVEVSVHKASLPHSKVIRCVPQTAFERTLLLVKVARQTERERERASESESCLSRPRRCCRCCLRRFTMNRPSLLQYSRAREYDHGHDHEFRILL